jgi:hypothetical protein
MTNSTLQTSQAYHDKGTLLGKSRYFAAVRSSGTSTKRGRPRLNANGTGARRLFADYFMNRQPRPQVVADYCTVPTTAYLVIMQVE